MYWMGFGLCVKDNMNVIQRVFHPFNVTLGVGVGSTFLSVCLPLTWWQANIFCWDYSKFEIKLLGIDNGFWKPLNPHSHWCRLHQIGYRCSMDLNKCRIFEQVNIFNHTKGPGPWDFPGPKMTWCRVVSSTSVMSQGRFHCTTSPKGLTGKGRSLSHSHWGHRCLLCVPFEAASSFNSVLFFIFSWSASVTWLKTNCIYKKKKKGKKRRPLRGGEMSGAWTLASRHDHQVFWVWR